MNLNFYLLYFLNYWILIVSGKKCFRHSKASVQLNLEKLKTIINPCGIEKLDALGENVKCEKAHLEILNSLFKFKLIESPCAVAMYLSTLMIESGNLTYNRNHYPPPGIVGMGTRFMLNAYNLFMFVKTNPDLFQRTEIFKLTDVAYDDNNDDSKKKILSFLMRDEYSFMTGAWWLYKGAELIMGCAIKMTCPPDNDVDTYFKKCMGIGQSDARMDLYQAVLKQLKS